MATAVLLGLLVLAASGVVIAHDPIAVLRAAHTALITLEGIDDVTTTDVVLQRSLYDCGPAALANLMVVLGAPHPDADSIAVLAGTTPQGTTLSGLQRASAAFGIGLTRHTAGVGTRAVPSTPFIAWMDQNHFVVVSERIHDTLEIIDPRIGRFMADERFFARHWSGEALLVAAPMNPGGRMTQTRSPPSEKSEANTTSSLIP